MRIPSPGPPSFSALCTYRKLFKECPHYREASPLPTPASPPCQPLSHHLVLAPSKKGLSSCACAESEAYYKVLTGCLITTWK